MRMSRKLVSIAAATALVAGVGMAAAAPASAATKKGTTQITLSGGTVVAALGAGLGVYALSPSTSTVGSGNAITVTLAAKQKSAPGSGITHTGGILFTNGAAGKLLGCNTPTIVLDGGPSNEAITCKISGAGAPLDGTEPAVLKLTNVKSKTKKGVTTITAAVGLNTTPIDVAPVLNGLLGTTIFQSGMALGTAKVTLS